MQFVLNSLIINDFRMGFHIPPYNSVNHLHLHCLGLPYRNRLIGMKYAEWMPWYSSGEKILNSL